ncbi:MAG TPA: nuclear transport factor 2 family protein [Dokdonella sp.]
MTYRLRPAVFVLAAAALAAHLPPARAADAPAAAPAAAPRSSAAPESDLLETMRALDRKLFDAYNRCDLDAFGSLFAPDVEFYHDTGGVTHSREEVVANTRKYICGKVRRELVPGTLAAYPIKDFGAIVEGEHRFCELASGRCEGIAKFVLIWRRDGDAWRVVRVLSYGHRAA